MIDCSWRPKRSTPRWDHPVLHLHTTYAQPRLPFVRSHRGSLVHRIRFWALLWERVDGVTRLRSASVHGWCAVGFIEKNGYSIGADVRLMADSSAELCRRCFPCELIPGVFETGRFDG